MSVQNKSRIAELRRKIAKKEENLGWAESRAERLSEWSERVRQAEETNIATREKLAINEKSIRLQLENYVHELKTDNPSWTTTDILATFLENFQAQQPGVVVRDGAVVKSGSVETDETKCNARVWSGWNADKQRCPPCRPAHPCLSVIPPAARMAGGGGRRVGSAKAVLKAEKEALKEIEKSRKLQEQNQRKYEKQLEKQKLQTAKSVKKQRKKRTKITK